MLKVVIITCSRNGTASRCLPFIAAEPNIRIAGVILARGAGTSRRRCLKRKVLKVLRIGPLGAINGVRMRKWYDNPAEDISEICKRLSIPFQAIEGLNGAIMEETLKQMNPDLGVSLGNGYIAPRIFEIPRLGMINLHTEILPAYQNARSIIWPIFCGDPYTGYTIHEISRQIDAGKILFQKRFPIRFSSQLEDTVRMTKLFIDSQFPSDVAWAIAHVEELKAKGVEQHGGGHYTTPSFWQFLKMVWMNRKFYRKSIGES